VVGSQTVLVLTPVLMITFLIATGVAVLASPTFPRRFGHAALFFALVRIVMALVDWYGGAALAVRIMDMTLIWVVIASVHLMGATRPLKA
jgi:Ni,Fe-hydrogenase I cytochrome b subunit